MTDGPRSILSRFVVLGGANVLATGLGFLVVLVVVDQYGAAGLGDVTLAFALAGYALTVAACGTDLWAVTHVAAKPEELARTTSTVIIIRFVVGLAALLVLVAVAAAVPRFREIWLETAIFGLAVFTTALNVSWVPQAIHRTNVFAAANFFTQVFYLGLVVAVAAAGLDLWAVAASKVASDLLVSLGLLLWSQRSVGPMAAPMPLPELVRFARDAAPIAWTQLVRGIAITSDVVIVGLLVDATSLGHYTAASKIFLTLLALSTAYFVILLPRIAERADRPDTAMAQEFRASLWRVLPLGALGLGLLAVIARPLLVLLFDETFTAAVVPLQVLCLAVFVTLVSRHYRKVLLARGRQRTDLRLSGISTGIHIVSKIALVPPLGITGAAVGTLLGELFLLVSEWAAARGEMRGE